MHTVAVRNNGTMKMLLPWPAEHVYLISIKLLTVGEGLNTLERETVLY